MGGAKGPSGNNCAILAADASRRAALLVACIRPVCALLAPCRAGASTPRDDTVIPGRALSGIRWPSDARLRRSSHECEKGRGFGSPPVKQRSSTRCRAGPQLGLGLSLVEGEGAKDAVNVPLLP